MLYFLFICLHQARKESCICVMGIDIASFYNFSINTSSHNLVQKLFYGEIYCQQILRIFFIFFCISNSWDCVNLRLKFSSLWTILLTL